MKKMSIDRIVGELAVCFNDQNQEIKIDKKLIPPEAKEGDIILYNNGVYLIDSDETEKRKLLARSLFSSLLDSNQDD